MTPLEIMSDEPDPSSSSSRSDISRISVAVTMLDPDGPPAVPAAGVGARRAPAAALSVSGAAAEALAARDAEISLVLADDAMLRRYNRDYRGIDKPTNVLAFATADLPGAGDLQGGADLPGKAEGPLLLGDVLLARETLTCEAGEQGKRPADHLSHLVVHGVLHLFGQDHQNEVEAKIMERLEVAALGRLGVADPYAGISADTMRVCG